MLVKNMTEFRKNMKNTFDQINETEEMVIISRSEDRDIVLLSLKTFNGMKETLYQMSSKANKEKLDKALADIEASKNIITKDLLAL